MQTPPSPCNVDTTELNSPSRRKSPVPPGRKRGACYMISPVNTPDNLPLPDLYLIDSRQLLAEVSRIRGLVLQVPFTETSHAATQTVVDALWRLERDMTEILKVQAQRQSSFVRKATGRGGGDSKRNSRPTSRR